MCWYVYQLPLVCWVEIVMTCLVQIFVIERYASLDTCKRFTGTCGIIYMWSRDSKFLIHRLTCTLACFMLIFIANNVNKINEYFKNTKTKYFSVRCFLCYAVTNRKCQLRLRFEKKKVKHEKPSLAACLWYWSMDWRYIYILINARFVCWQQQQQNVGVPKIVRIL